MTINVLELTGALTSYLSGLVTLPRFHQPILNEKPTFQLLDVKEILEAV